MANYKNFKIKVPRNLPQSVKEAIAQEVIDEVIKRTQRGTDKDGDGFPSYSKSYKDSFEFQFKSGSSVDLTLSGEMLDSMEVVEVKDNGEIIIGYDNADSALQGKVEGNVRGSYGQSSGNRSKARNFLGLPKEALQKIIKSYTDGDPATAERRAAVIGVTADLDIGFDIDEGDDE